ncbi:MAG: hypothetical protein ABW189_05500 [Rickettsiales bacterium]
MGGASYPFSQNASAALGYRYFSASDMEDKTPGMKLKADDETHNAELGMRVGFYDITMRSGFLTRRKKTV